MLGEPATPRSVERVVGGGARPPSARRRRRRRPHVRAHVHARRDQSAEALGVRERVAGPAQGACAAAQSRVAPQHLVARAPPAGGALPLAPLTQPDAVDERRTRVGRVEPLGDDRHEQDGDGQDEREPEGRRRHDGARRPDVRVAEQQVRVEDKRQCEVEHDAAPDHDVVEERPVGGLERALTTDGQYAVITGHRAGMGQPAARSQTARQSTLQL